MSAWRVAAKAIYARGGIAMSKELHELSGSPFGPLQELLRMKLATSTGKNGNQAALYTLTPKGVAFVEGRLEVIRRPHNGYGRKTRQMVWKATWIDSLPRGLRLEPAPGQRVMEQCA